MLVEKDQEAELAEVEIEEVETEVEAIEPEAEDDATEVNVEAEEVSEEGDDDTGEDEPAEAAALTVTIEGEEPEEDAGAGIRNLRQAHKDQKKRIKELEEKLKSQDAPESALGDKPTLEAFDYDAGKFEAAIIDWTERKRAQDTKQVAEQQKQEQAKEAYLGKLQGYQQKKAALGAKDFDEAEEAVLDGLSTAQQSVIIANASKPEILIYALGKNPNVMGRLAEKTDLIEFAFELAKLESNLKVTGTSKPKPEKRVSGSNGPALSTEKKLKALEDEADRTGDRTKLLAHKRQMARQNRG